jgi:hypothetical protein
MKCQCDCLLLSGCRCSIQCFKKKQRKTKKKTRKKTEKQKKMVIDHVQTAASLENDRKKKTKFVLNELRVRREDEGGEEEEREEEEEEREKQGKSPNILNAILRNFKVKNANRRYKKHARPEVGGWQNT